MSRPGIDRVFERRLSSLVNSGQPQILQGGRKGVEKESLRVMPDGSLARTAASAAARLGAHQRAHHHRLFRGAHRAGNARLRAQLGAAAVPARPAPVRLPPPGRGAAVGDQHAVRHRARRGHSAGAIRQLARRAHEDRVPQRPRPALRAHDAGDLRRALQLLLPAAVLGSVGGGARRVSARCGVRLGQLFRSAAQLPPLRLAGAVPVRRIAGGVQVFCAAATGCGLRPAPRSSRTPPACA